MTAHAHIRSPRWIAALLALLFVLQSAAQAGSGCVSLALRGRCCCAPAEASQPANGDAQPMRSCCAQRERSTATPDTSSPRSESPSFDVQRGCHCTLAPLPHAPANTPSRASSRTEAETRDGFSRWIETARVAIELESNLVPAVEPSPPEPPRPVWLAQSARRLVARGLIGFVFDLGSVRL